MVINRMNVEIRNRCNLYYRPKMFLSESELLKDTNYSLKMTKFQPLIKSIKSKRRHSGYSPFLSRDGEISRRRSEEAENPGETDGIITDDTPGHLPI